MLDSPSATEGQSAPESANTDVAAESSSAQTQGSENKSMLDAVNAALDGSEKSPDSETQEQAADASQQAKPEDKPEEIDEQSIKSLSKGAQSRIRELSGRVKEFRAQADEFKTKAESFDRISSMMNENSLSVDDVNGGFEIMALIKNDPQAALRRLQPIVQNLLQASGYSLGDDLQQAVAAGEITEARARELSQARAEARNTKSVTDFERQRREQAESERQNQALVKTAVDTANEWNSAKAAADPDWHLKQSRVAELVELHLHKTQSFPRNSDEAKALFEEKLKIVNDDMKRLRPVKPSIKPTSGGASRSQPSAPKSMLDVVNAALGDA